VQYKSREHKTAHNVFYNSNLRHNIFGIQNLNTCISKREHSTAACQYIWQLYGPSFIIWTTLNHLELWRVMNQVMGIQEYYLKLNTFEAATNFHAFSANIVSSLHCVNIKFL